MSDDTLGRAIQTLTEHGKKLAEVEELLVRQHRLNNLVRAAEGLDIPDDVEVGALARAVKALEKVLTDSWREDGRCGLCGSDGHAINNRDSAHEAGCPTGPVYDALRALGRR